jgi:hypothetical protein
MPCHSPSTTRSAVHTETTLDTRWHYHHGPKRTVAHTHSIDTRYYCPPFTHPRTHCPHTHTPASRVVGEGGERGPPCPVLGVWTVPTLVSFLVVPLFPQFVCLGGWRCSHSFVVVHHCCSFCGPLLPTPHSTIRTLVVGSVLMVAAVSVLSHFCCFVLVVIHGVVLYLSLVALVVVCVSGHLFSSGHSCMVWFGHRCGWLDSGGEEREKEGEEKRRRGGKKERKEEGNIYCFFSFEKKYYC